MATKITLNTLANVSGAETTFLSQLNENFTDLADQIDQLLSRDGESPNSWSANQDANSNRLINLTDGVGAQDAATVSQLSAATSGSGSNVGSDGVGVYVGKSGSTFQFRHVAAGSSKITVVDNSNDIDIDVDESALTHSNITGSGGTIHTDHAAVSINSGSGLSGGSTIDSSLTLNVDIASETGKTTPVTTDVVLIENSAGGTINKATLANLSKAIVLSSTSGYDANDHVDHTGVSISTAANSGLAGGGDISTTRTLTLDVSNLSTVASVDGATDYLPIYDDSGSVTGKVLVNNLPSAGNTIITQDEGVNVDTSATTLNFVGTGVTATDAGGGVTTITVGGGAAPVDSVFGLTGTVSITGLTAESTIDGAADYVVVYDGSATAHRKVLINDLPSSSGGETNTASNVGTAGVGVYKQKTGVDLEFKKINAGSSAVTITDDTGNSEIDIDIDETVIDHNNLTNYSANRHIDHSAVSVLAGVGLSGGGTIAASRTLTLDINGLTTDSIAAADTLAFYDSSEGAVNKLAFSALEATLNHDSLTGFVSNEHVDHTSVTLTAGTGLTGGGDISANRSFALDISGLTTDSSPDGAADYVATYDASGTTHKKVLLNNLPGGSGGGFTDSHLGNVTSGTTIEFTSIPAGTKMFTIGVYAISGSGTDELELKLGTSSTYTTATAKGGVSSQGASTNWPTDAAQLTRANSSADQWTGVIEGRLVSGAAETDDYWVISSQLGEHDSSETVNYSAGGMYLLNDLTRLKLGWSGSNTFTAGYASLYYQ